MDEKNQISLEQKVLELEERVRKLEQRVLVTQTQSPQIKIEQTAKVEYHTPEKLATPQIIKQEKVSKKKIGEAEIGKYLIGVLAAILIFVAAASFISLIWASLSDVLRLSLILGLGALLTITGFYLISKSKNPISALVLGTGAGLIFISILSANMFFNFIGNITAIVLVGIWSIFFILSYKYTKMFFTTVIAYIGSVVALLLGVTLVRNGVEFIALMLYVTSTSAVLILTSHKWLDEKRKIISILLSMFSYAILLVSGFGLDNIEITLFITIFMEYILFNYLYYRVKKLEKKVWGYLPVNAVMSIITLMFLNRVCSPFGSDISLVLTWFFVINLLQMIIFEFFFSSIKRVNIIYYLITQVISVIIFNVDKFNTFAGISVISIILLIFQQFNHHRDYRVSISVIAIIDSLLSYFAFLKSDVILLYGVLQVISVTCVLFDTYKHKRYSKSGFKEGLLKTIWLLIYIINAYYIPYTIIDMIIKQNSIRSAYANMYSEVISYMILSITICTIVASGYFKDWKSDKFKWFTKNEAVLQDRLSVVFYIITSLVYIMGLKLITLPNIWYQQLIAILSVIAVALVQSKSLIENCKYQPLVGLWIGFKYSLLTWTIMLSVLNVKLESVMMSVAGLIIALLCIALGFKLKMKSLRLYGLIITMLMVLKFIAVDLSQENSIIRIVALFVGGVICFGITLLYNKLNKESN
jgi:hypothetical protein